MFTRFHDDPDRIIKRLQQQTDPGRWVLDVPGNGGDRPCFALDPQIIPQKWGANLWTNVVDIQSSMLGLDRRLNRDAVGSCAAGYKTHTFTTQPLANTYPVCDRFLTTEQSRATCPAWMFRDVTQNHSGLLLGELRPFAPVEIPFVAFEDTRNREKDEFARRRRQDIIACSSTQQPNNPQDYTVPSEMRAPDRLPYAPLV